jgi:hypothetical protein
MAATVADLADANLRLFSGLSSTLHWQGQRWSASRPPTRPSPTEYERLRRINPVIRWLGSAQNRVGESVADTNR